MYAVPPPASPRAAAASREIDQGIHKGKMKVAQNEKQQKTTWVPFFHKHQILKSVWLIADALVILYNYNASKYDR